MQNRAANKEIFALEDRVLDLTIQAKHQEGDEQAATLEQLEAAKKTLEVTRWSHEMAPPELNGDIKTT